MALVLLSVLMNVRTQKHVSKDDGPRLHVYTVEPVGTYTLAVQSHVSVVVSFFIEDSPTRKSSAQSLLATILEAKFTEKAFSLAKNYPDL